MNVLRTFVMVAVCGAMAAWATDAFAKGKPAGVASHGAVKPRGKTSVAGPAGEVGGKAPTPFLELQNALKERRDSKNSNAGSNGPQGEGGLTPVGPSTGSSGLPSSPIPANVFNFQRT